MKLTELAPRWASDRYYRNASGVVVYDGMRQGMGITFDCPHCRVTRLAVFFSNPRDGLPPLTTELDPPHAARKLWARSGETFDTLSLSPSIDASADGHWHGFITNGEVT